MLWVAAMYNVFAILTMAGMKRKIEITVKKAIVISTSHLQSEFKMSEHVTHMDS